MESLWWVIKRTVPIRLPNSSFLWVPLLLVCLWAFDERQLLWPTYTITPFTGMQIAAVPANWIAIYIVLSFIDILAVLQIPITDCSTLNFACFPSDMACHTARITGDENTESFHYNKSSNMNTDSAHSWISSYASINMYVGVCILKGSINATLHTVEIW